ncbi:TA system antitoxin ParD family protein [Peptostreptococcus faecalis]|uniref:TA system antitoxin ParD family protein n=1 Tax=Peptostreptococcus faecalis TaxID=2045015 RepID=UPI000C7BBDBD|nr:PTS ascorbate transporter subunit IIC [Peptostreptococcus faecalis]
MSGKKKQIPLRISSKLYEEIAAWSEDEFRSINGQIEYLLTEAVKERKKNHKNIELVDEEENSEEK